MEWISVKDRLPKPRWIVLVAGGVGYIDDLDRWMTVTGFDYPGRPIQWEVTHWAELQFPPGYQIQQSC